MDGWTVRSDRNLIACIANTLPPYREKTQERIKFRLCKEEGSKRLPNTFALEFIFNVEAQY